MVVYVVSGNGQAAGKTTLARKLVGEKHVHSIASGIRAELQALYPKYEWYNTDQKYKDFTLVKEYPLDRPVTIRDALIHHGERQTDIHPSYWVDRLVSKLITLTGVSHIAIDDVRRVIELEKIRKSLTNVHHFHVIHPSAVFESKYDNAALCKLADYQCVRHVEDRYTP